MIGQCLSNKNESATVPPPKILGTKQDLNLANKKHQRLASLLHRFQTSDKFAKCDAATAASTRHHHAGHIAPGNTVIMSCTIRVMP